MHAVPELLRALLEGLWGQRLPGCCATSAVVAACQRCATASPMLPSGLDSYSLRPTRGGSTTSVCSRTGRGIILPRCQAAGRVVHVDSWLACRLRQARKRAKNARRPAAATQQPFPAHPTHRICYSELLVLARYGRRGQRRQQLGAWAVKPVEGGRWRVELLLLRLRRSALLGRNLRGHADSNRAGEPGLRVGGSGKFDGRWSDGRLPDVWISRSGYT